ncbi:MAG: hypothetical protein Q7V01_04200 [Vicinamibacterales bacterium]|nr:hypothetical protein [Vicinamibacterales bacterium]
MNRSTTLLLIAVALAGYGVYVARYVPAMLVGPAVPALLIGFVLQAVCAFAAAFGVWRDRPWATAALVLLGVSVAGTWLFEAFILGIVAYLRALLMAVLALVITLGIAVYLTRRRSVAVRG